MEMMRKAREGEKGRERERLDSTYYVVEASH